MENVHTKNDPGNREDTGRNQDGTFKPGVSGNPEGRPKNTMKDYVRQKFMAMTVEEKEEFLTKVSPDIMWKMGEGNPASDTTIKGDRDNPIPVTILGDVPKDNSDTKDTEVKE